MKKAKLIERIVIIAFCCILVVSAGLIPLVSYNTHQNYVKEMEENKPKPVVKSTLTGIEAYLKDGVKYYANNKASVKSSDLKVVAVYKQGEETYTEDVPEDKINFSTPDEFAFNGGDITVTYKSKTAKIPVTLEEVKLVQLKMTEEPYLVAYETGSSFTSEGLEAVAVYNDGSEKILTSESLVVEDKTSLKKTDSKVTVCYTDNGVTKTFDIPIKVADDFSNGKVKKIFAKENAIVTVGEQISSAKVTLIGEYENGNKLVLSSDKYDVSARTETAVFGKKYQLDVSYTEDSSVTAVVPVTVRLHTEGEDGTLVGGKKRTETEYVVSDGNFVKGDSVTFAGGFASSVRDGNESSASFTIDSYLSGSIDITLRCANSNLRKDSDSNYYMAPLQVNTILDMTVNGEPYEITDDVIVSGISTKSETYLPLYNVYSTFLFKSVPISAGVNTIKLTFKTSTKGEINSWNESPSEFNIDYVEFDNEGTDVSVAGKISSIEADISGVEYASKVSDISVATVGVYANGTKTKLSSDEYNVTIEGINDGSEYLSAGKYTVKVALKSDSSVKFEKSFEVEKDDLILTAEKAILYEEHNGTSSNYLRLKDSYITTYNEETKKFINEKSEKVIYGFDWSSTAKNAKSGTKPMITWTFGAIKGSYTLRMKINNAYITKQADETYTMNKYNLSDAITIMVNGVEVKMKAVEMPVLTDATSDNLFNYFFEVELADVELNNGENSLVVIGNTSCTLKNCWSEVPAPRIAWAKFEEK